MVPPLPPYDHPTAWVESRSEEIGDFKGNDTPTPEFQKNYCTSRKEDISMGSKSIRGESSIIPFFMTRLVMNPQEYLLFRWITAITQTLAYTAVSLIGYVTAFTAFRII